MGKPILKFVTPKKYLINFSFNLVKLLTSGMYICKHNYNIFVVLT